MDIPLRSSNTPLILRGSNDNDVEYRRGNTDGMIKVNEVLLQCAEETLMHQNYEAKFTFGFINCLFVIFVNVKFPEHAWILGIVELIFLIPVKIWHLRRSKPLNKIFTLFEFSWITVFSFACFFLLFLTLPISNSDVYGMHVHFTAQGIFTGPMIASCFLGFVSLTFHDFRMMSSFFIHFLPTVRAYHSKWNASRLREAWPEVFNLDYDRVFWPNKDGFVGTIFGNTFIAFIIWFLAYSTWQWFIGLDLPRKHRQKKLANGEPAPTVYDTVFHENMRTKLASHYICHVILKKPMSEVEKMIETNDFDRKTLVVYMTLYFIFFLLVMVVIAYPVYLSKYVHGAFLISSFILSVWRGANHYTYRCTRMYGEVIRTKFAVNLKESTSSSLSSNARNTSYPFGCTSQVSRLSALSCKSE